MAFAGINHWAVPLAALAAWLFGALYYSALAGPWQQAQEFPAHIRERLAQGMKAQSPLPFVLSFLAELLMAYVLAGVIGHLGPGQVTIRNGIISGAFIWAGFVLTTLAVNNAYGFRRPQLTLIDALHWLGVLAIMGAVIGAMGV